VVEHDEDVMKAADYIIDIGPEAGFLGGELDGRKIETLTIVIKPTDNASYKNMVDALDEMQILNIGTYVIDKINGDDEKLLKSRNVKM
jgi:hypothetical protein